MLWQLSLLTMICLQLGLKLIKFRSLPKLLFGISKIFTHYALHVSRYACIMLQYQQWYKIILHECSISVLISICAFQYIAMWFIWW